MAIIIMINFVLMNWTHSLLELASRTLPKTIDELTLRYLELFDSCYFESMEIILHFAEYRLSS